MVPDTFTLELTKSIGDVRARYEDLRKADYSKNRTAEVLQINYLAHVRLLLNVIDKLVERLAE